jgi:hypothetical protein
MAKGWDGHRFLHQAALHLRGIDQVLDSGPTGVQQTTLKQLFSDLDGIVFLSGERPWSWGSLPDPLMLFPLELGAAGYGAQLAMWRRLSMRRGCTSWFPGTTCLLRRSTPSGVRRARSAHLRGPDVVPSLDDLEQACRTRPRVPFNGIARRIEARHSWQDIVLPPDQLVQLKMLCSHALHRARVYGEWGFERSAREPRAAQQRALSNQPRHPSLPNEVLKGAMLEQPYPIRAFIAQPERTPSAWEFWGPGWANQDIHRLCGDGHPSIGSGRG